MSVKVIYFVHGTTTDNEAKIASGWKPGVLSEKGKSQAIALRDLIDRDSIDIVFCSDLQRAIDSTELVFENKKKVIIDKRLRECNYGLLDGKPNSTVIYEDHIIESFPEGESMQDVEKRLREFCSYVLEEFDGKHIAIVAHKAPQLAIEVITKGLSWEEAIEKDWRKTKAWQPGWSYEIV